MSASPVEALGRRLQLGMVGGGSNSIIGETHRIAFRADGIYELVAGAMSRDPDVAAASARAELIDPDRSYSDFRVMAERESQRDDGIDAVVIATLPESHFEIASEFLDHGIDVICEKPMTRTAGEAARLAAHVDETDRLFTVTHCYTGYPMVRQAREMVRDGALGAVHLIEAQFALGVPGMVHEPADPTERHWRFDASSMGPAAILGEVGSHAHNLVEYVTGSRAKRVSARLDTIAARREVYDNAYVTVEYESGAIGRIWTSYLAVGIEHGLAFKIFGDEASLAWSQEEPELLWHNRLGGPKVALSRASAGLSEISIRSARFGPGHPEGYALAFANLYRDFATVVVEGAKSHVAKLLPNVHDGLATMRFLEAAERSHERDGAYENIEQPVMPDLDRT